MCTLRVKLAWKVLEFLMCIFMLETFGYEFSRAPQKGLQEGPKGSRNTALALSINKHNDAPFVY